MDFNIPKIAQNLYGAKGVNMQEATVSESDAPKVDASYMGKAMEMFQGLMKADPTMKQKADQLWKFLDDLHRNDPKEYNKFINKHISEGQEEIEKEKEKKMKTDGIQSEPVLCAKIRVYQKLTTPTEEAKEPKVDIKLFEFESESDIKSKEEEKSSQKYLAKPSIYLNVCMSEKVKGPLKKDYTYADPKDDKSWAIIPISYSLESESDDEVIYDAHINKQVIEQGKTDPRILNSLMLVVLKRFEAFMSIKFKMDIKTPHFLSDRKYKSSDIKKDKPSLHILMPD